MKVHCSIPCLIIAAGLLSCACAHRVFGDEVYLAEPFAANPLTTGDWQTHGDASLFAWSELDQNLTVTWDSSHPNSYFYRPIGMTLTRSNDFLLGFDLRLSEVQIGTHSGMPFTFQLSVGLLNLTNATDPGFFRGAGFSAPNLVEFSYFPDSGFGATVAPTIISSGNDYNSGGFTYPFAIDTGANYHVEMRFIASQQRMVTRLLRNGTPVGPVNDARLDGAFTDFAVDQLAIMSYSDDGQDPMYAGSIRAVGTIDNLFLMTPPPIATHSGGFAGQIWSGAFLSHRGWSYQLERSLDFAQWASVGQKLPGTGAELTLSDPTPPVDRAFYRVVARKE